MGLVDREHVQTIATASDFALGATASTSLQAAHVGQEPLRAYVEFAHLKAGDVVLTLKIGGRIVLQAAATTIVQGGPFIGKAGEAITIEHPGAAVNGEYSVTMGLLAAPGGESQTA